MKFKAIIFDLDGTLYPQWKLYHRALPFVLCHYKLFLAIQKARKIIRAQYANPAHSAEAIKNSNHFRLIQTSKVAQLMGIPIQETEDRLKKMLYGTLEGYLIDMPLYRGTKAMLQLFQEKNIKLALLSDLPPQKKIAYLQLEDIFWPVLGSEESGYLKPSPHPFLMVAQSLQFHPREFLVVGNSVKHDALGARRAGMRVAIRSYFRCGTADFFFTKWEDLIKYVLEENG